MRIDLNLTPQDLATSVKRAFEIAGDKIIRLDRRWNPRDGAPVFTIEGKYTVRGWTEWTQGFQYGSALLVFEATGDSKLLEMARANIASRMATHITHIGVHDHGFNNISTYGNLRRLMLDGRIPGNEWELRFYELALAVSGSVQALRWSATSDGLGYVYSFNGPQSLFIDTIRSMRILAVANQIGHRLLGENDQPISLLARLIVHGLTTAKYNIFYGNGRDSYDVPSSRGRTSQEALFNPNDGRYRCPSSQQGYSPFSTWTRGLAWAILGFAEQLEFLATLSPSNFGSSSAPAKQEVISVFENAARATCDFYIDHSAWDGVCYWDTQAPGIALLGDYRGHPADPWNDYEPVDSSAAAIAAQGFLRFGKHLGADQGKPYVQAGLSIAKTLFAEPYLSQRPSHEGLLLHSVYHRPNGWDHIPPGRRIPCDESSMWGDYHLLELALLIKKLAGGAYFTFFDSTENGSISIKGQVE